MEVGQPAPDFTLNDTAGQPVSLGQFRDQKYVVLHTFPAAFTGG